MSADNWQFYPEALHPVRVCDVVWCLFPEDLIDIKPGPKSRPGLVRAVKRQKSTGQIWLSVSYGTSKLKTESRPLDLRVTNAEDMVAAGLPQATRFDLDWCTLLPWAAEFFTIRFPYKTPVVGSLAPRSRARLVRLLDIRSQYETAERLDDED
ncbi:MAG: hypothetical protein WCY11_18855 [Novosphingobium sp.]